MATSSQVLRQEEDTQAKGTILCFLPALFDNFPASAHGSLVANCMGSHLYPSGSHVLVYWDEEGLTSVVKLSQVVEPTSPRKGSKAKVKWGRSIFPASIIEIGSQKDVKKKEKDFHSEKANVGEKDVNEGTSAKKRKTTEGKKEKGKKKVAILCVTDPPSPDSTPDKECDTPAEAALLVSPEVPTQGIQPNSAESDMLKQVLDKVQTLQMTLQGVENFVTDQFAVMQALQDVQAAKILELQSKLDDLECTTAVVNASRQLQPDECDGHLSPGAELCQRQVLQDVTNVSGQASMPQICNTPARAQCQFKSAADVIGANSKLLQSVAKAGRLAVKLARESYFGEDMMCVSTVSGLPKDKLKEIKARLYEVYRFDNLVEFEPLWQKCLVAIGKACQGLRAKNTISIP